MAVGGLEFDIPCREDFGWINGDFQRGYEMLGDGVILAAQHLGKTLANNISVQGSFAEYGEDQASEHVGVMGQWLNAFPAKRN